MAAPKATNKTQSDAIDRQINDLSVRGRTQTEIAAAVGISQQAVAARLKKLNQRAVADRDAHIAHEVRTLDLVQRQALDAWDAEPLPAHLANVIRISESRRKLLGLDAPARAEIEQSGGLTINVNYADDHPDTPEAP
jgi:DNA-binding CsgD family transcriptional regulator